MESVFSTRDDRQPRPYLNADDLDEIKEMRQLPPVPAAESQRRGLREASLGLLNSLGAVHWVGGLPEIARRNPWGIRDLVFNPEWVKRPVYDLLWRSAPRAAEAGLLTDRQVREVLPTRTVGASSGADVYERTAFTDEDRGRVLELMRACHLVFDSPHGQGVLLPDLLDTAQLGDDASPAGGWRYSADFLPEKVVLRFIAEQYRTIDTRAGHCFRNRVIWRRSGQEVVLEAYFSPSGGIRPFVLIRPSAPDRPVPEAVAASIGFLLDEIFFDEGLGEVRRELRPIGELCSDGQFVFRRLSPAKLGENVKPRFQLVFDGTDLGSNWRNTMGLLYLHTLVSRPERFFHAHNLSAVANPDREAGFGLRQEDVEAPQESKSEAETTKNKLSTTKTQKLKLLLKTAEAKLQEAEGAAEQMKYASQVEALTNEIERRDSPGLKKLMNAVQQQLKKAVAELKEQMKAKGVPAASLDHFDHCTSSGDHPFHFSYRPASPPDWETA